MIRECPLAFPKGNGLHPVAEDIIKGLLQKDPEDRLGFQGGQQIKEHPWFEGVDWEKVEAKQYKPPFVPKVAGDDWVNNFDSEFTNEEPVNSFVPVNNRAMLNKFNEDDFQNF